MYPIFLESVLEFYLRQYGLVRGLFWVSGVEEGVEKWLEVVEHIVLD